MSQIFQFQEYRPYLELILKQKGHGIRAAMAQAINCHTAHISRVLSGSAHLTLEQACSLNQFFGHSEDEGHFFLLLVHKERAGSLALKKHYDSQLQDLLKKRLNLKDRFKVESHLSHDHQAKYFSSWIYAAVHVLVSIPQFQTKEALSAHLGLTLNHLSGVLDFLETVGLIQLEGSRYSVGKTRLHLGNDSSLISKHHMNWRIQALKSLDRELGPQSQEDLHYSSIISVSEKDALKLKTLLVECLEKFNQVVKDSQDECAQVFTLDFFRLR